MEIVYGSKSFPSGLPSPVLTIGNFDGVHIGHQRIFRTVGEHARQLGGTSVCYTFDPHPQKILAPDRCPPLLVTPRKKLELIAREGIDVTLVERFTLAFSQQTAADFIRDILVERIRPVEVYVGHDFHFGKGREASFAALEEMGVRFGFRVTVIEEVRVGTDEVSSSLIRRLVADGRVEDAARLLGHAFTLEGRVVEGAGRGRGLGFATANLDVENEVKPADGVYAVFGRLRAGVEPGAGAAAAREGNLTPGVANVGVVPTFGEKKRSVEVHLLDFDRDLYDDLVEVLFLARLREERKFSGPTALAAQIRKDVEQARAIHAANGWRVGKE
ncbi:MAG: riboflavin biosynthesis protein RibF [Deltaproteobacteria bacterium RBG_13_65_10]|nr:MAG: riboflavin biosynthesis protein RibF [Deltaproteobacteria bacterium RBG_13_65_10]